MARSCKNCGVKQYGAFKDLSDDELNVIESIKVELKFKRGKPLFTEEDKFRGVFCVRSGICKLTKSGASGKERIVRLGSKGSLLGERACLDEYNSFRLSAVAIEETHACFIPKTEIFNFFKSNRKFASNVMKSVCGDLDNKNFELYNDLEYTAKQRLLLLLMQLKEEFGVNTDNSLKVKLTRVDLASMVGVVSETCSRMLAELSVEGKIKIDRNSIIVN